MNAPRKKSAVKTYSSLHVEGKSKEEVIAAISADEKGYSESEASEIYDAIVADSETPTPKEKAADSVVENVIKAASRVVDTDIKPSGKTDVSPSGGTGADSEWLRNKTTGNEQRMNGVYARKIARRKPNEFEIIVKK